LLQYQDRVSWWNSPVTRPNLYTFYVSDSNVFVWVVKALNACHGEFVHLGFKGGLSLALKVSMMKFITAFFVCLFANVSSFATPMGEQLSYFIQHPEATLTLKQQTALSQFQFVFLGGYMNEVVRKQYFDVSAETLQAMGVDDISILFPSSTQSADLSSQELVKELRKIHKSNPKPIIFIGHSMGGLIGAAAMIRDPNLILSGIVTEAVFVQSPIAADSFLDQQGIFGRTVSTALRISSGHNSLYTPHVQRLISEPLQRMDPTVRARLSQKMKYVISSKGMKDSAFALRFMSSFFGVDIDYDGLVGTMDMYLPGFGIVLGKLVADHLELFINNRMLIGDNFNVEVIRAFMKSLAIAILESRDSRNHEYYDLTAKLRAEWKAPPKACGSFFGI
jgi:hypothetical protein